MTAVTVTLLAGSKPGRRAELTESVADLAVRLVGEGHRIRFGGGSTGLMGSIADAALDAGGHVHGVIPEFLARAEVLHRGLSETTVVTSMAERKGLLLGGVDAVIVVPGGIGTLEEFFDMLSQLVLGESTTRLAIYDCNGFWRPLRDLLAALVDEQFVSWDEAAAVPFLTGVEDVVRFLEQPWTPPPSRTAPTRRSVARV